MKALGSKKLTITLLASNESPNADALTQYIQSQWTKVLEGISVKVSSIPGKNAYAKASDGDFDVYVSGWGGDFNDPMTFMQIMESGTSYNYGKWTSAKYDALIKRALNQDANDPQQRAGYHADLPADHGLPAKEQGQGRHSQQCRDPVELQVRLYPIKRSSKKQAPRPVLVFLVFADNLEAIAANVVLEQLQVPLCQVAQAGMLVAGHA